MMLFLGGCSDEVDPDIQNFVEKVKKRKSAYIDPLPSVTVHTPYEYTAAHLRSPFEAVTSLVEKPMPNVREGPSPDINRPRELLEAYPLDSLKMVGTLVRNEEYFALLKDHNGIIHRLAKGNYIGQNFGKINEISEIEIEIKEWLPDAQGGWQPRNVLIKLGK